MITFEKYFVGLNEVRNFIQTTNDLSLLRKTFRSDTIKSKIGVANDSTLHAIFIQLDLYFAYLAELEEVLSKNRLPKVRALEILNEADGVLRQVVKLITKFEK